MSRILLIIVFDKSKTLSKELECNQPLPCHAQRTSSRN